MKKLDGRTKAAKSIKSITNRISSNLDNAAYEILLEDIASLTIVKDLCLKRALKDQKKTVTAKGALHPAMSNYLKCQASIKSALLALKRFESKKRGLADLFSDDTENAVSG